jgi:acyl-CoA thioester hydrolase
MTRFRDLDALWHVNASVYITLLEEARLRYFSDVARIAIPGELGNWVLADVHCRYRAPLRYGDTIVVAVKVTWIKRSSFGAAFEMVSQGSGNIVASGEYVQVHVSGTGASAPIPNGIRSAIEQFEAIDSSQPG